jgi:hypothetical protein
MTTPARTRGPLLDLFFKLLRDRTQPAELRTALLSSLLLLRFNSPLMADRNADFIDALRSLIDDPDETLRARGLEALAQQKDPVAQKRIADSVSGKEPALLPQAKAIQLLGYDIHSNHYPMLRELVEKSDSDDVKREAVRVLSSDPGSADLLRKVFRDKETAGTVRRASARALMHLAPEEFAQDAVDVALDHSDDDQVRATSLTALSHIYDADTTTVASALDTIDKLSKNDGLKNAVSALRSELEKK